jgi:hypothetical protein
MAHVHARSPLSAALRAALGVVARHLCEVLRLTATAARAFAQVAQVKRPAQGLSTENYGGHDGGPLVPAEVERKSTAELVQYLTPASSSSRKASRM